jgi:hypothetical protein
MRHQIAGDIECYVVKKGQPMRFVYRTELSGENHS